MYKIILFTIVVGSYMFAGNESQGSSTQTNAEKFSWVADTSDDNFKADAGRRRGKGPRGRRRGGSGLK